jgi:murein DD-endopeptidase MepM/ murein hydrolase activator NlpD
MALLAASAMARPAVAQVVSFPPPLELRVPKPPTVATGQNGSFLTYELHITNFGARPVTVKRVEVVTGDATPRVLLSLTDSALARSLARPGVTASAAERATLGGGLRAVVFLWVPVDGRTPPTSVRQRVSVEQGSGDSARTQTLEGPAVPVTRAVAEIGPPLRGGPWLAANGPANNSGHRRALIPVGGTAAISQRFAIDYVKLGAGDRTFNGDSLKNESHYAEGNDALAVADGRVVEVKDGIPENVPGITSRAVPITLETVGGNHVIIDIGNGRYAFYAHLKPGSIRVHEGDRVRRGQVIGLVGNTGNSTEPHLHFHVSDANSPLGSEGIPYTYDAFEIVGRCVMFNASCEHTAPVAHHHEIPLANELVRFP